MALFSRKTLFWVIVVGLFVMFWRQIYSAVQGVVSKVSGTPSGTAPTSSTDTSGSSV